MVRYLTICIFAILLCAAGAAAQDEDSIIVKQKPTSALAGVHCAEVELDSVREVTCFLSFPDSVPNFFYETDTVNSRVVIKLLNTRVGGLVENDRTDTVKVGPVTSIKVHEEIQNKNETMKALTPEWYWVVLVTLDCSPMIQRQKDLVLSPVENAITISFPWPRDEKKRAKLYTIAPKKQRKAIIASISGATGAALAVGGYFIYRHIRYGDDSKELSPVLPDHPQIPRD